MDKFVLWTERNLSANITSFWIENLVELGKFENEPFAYYEVIPTDDGTNSAVKWSVTLDNLEEFGAVETVTQAREKIFAALAKGGVDLRSLPHYALSKVRGMFIDGGKYILQHFKLDSWIPRETWFIHQVREDSVIRRIAVYNADKSAIESFPHESESKTTFNHVTFARQYLSRLHPELHGTTEVAERIGWDQRKVAMYWRQGRFPFPDIFIGEQPTWDEESGQWVGGGRPLWRPETVEKWK